MKTDNNKRRGKERHVNAVPYKRADQKRESRHLLKEDWQQIKVSN